jgi:adenosine/AMP kinase
MELKTVTIEKPADVNCILGQAHFIKTVEDIHEALVSAVPKIKFGLAFCESSGPALVRWSGTNAEMIELAKKNALAIAAGHSFIIFLRDCYPHQHSECRQERSRGLSYLLCHGQPRRGSARGRRRRGAASWA